MKALLLVLLAAAARADLTLPKSSPGMSGPAAADAPDAEALPGFAAAAAAFKPLDPMLGEFSGKVACGRESDKLTLTFGESLQRGRAAVLYTIESPSRGGFGSGFTLVPGGAPGEYDSWDGAHLFNGLKFKVHGRELTARPPAGAKLGPDGRAEARLIFDKSWKSVSLSLRDGKGARCMGTLPRTHPGPRR